MKPLIHWISIPALVVGTPTPLWAVSYLSLEQAQQSIFPGATLQKMDLELSSDQRKAIQKASGVKVRSGKLRLWKVESGGWFFVDEVIGKHEFITYAVGLNDDGSVKQIEVMDYRENYGGEVRKSEWRSQFVGKNSASSIRLEEDIKNITGATLSCRHLTEGVKRLVVTYDLVLKK